MSALVRAALAAGKFSSYRPAEDQPPERTPLALWQTADSTSRQLLLGHNSIGGFATLVEKDVRIINVPKINGAGLSNIVTGTLGDKCARDKIFPIQVSESDFLGDVIQYLVPRATGVNFSVPVGKELDRGNNVTAFAARIPKVLPLPNGHDIIEGPITDAGVQMKLNSLHPTAQAWLEAVLAEQATPNNNPIKDGKKDDELPRNTASLPIRDSFTLEMQPITPPSGTTSDTHPFHQVHLRASFVRQCNEDRYYQEHPDEDDRQQQGGTPGQENNGGNGNCPPFVDTSRGPAPSANNDRDDITVKTAAAQQQLKRVKPIWQIWGASVTEVDENGEKSQRITPGMITQEFEANFTAHSSSQQGQALRCSLETYADERQMSDNFLHKNISFPHINTTLSQLTTRGNMKSTTMDEDQQNNKRQLNVSMFLAEPTKLVDKKAYDEYVAGTHQTEQEEIVGEASQNRSKIGTTVFTDGRQETRTDVIVLDANCDCFASFIIEYNEGNPQEWPVIINIHRTLANQLYRKDVNKWMDKFIVQAPWIPHCMVNMRQAIWAQLAKVTMNPRNQNEARAGRDLPTSTFKHVFSTFETLTNAINDAVNTSTLGVFQQSPSTWVETPGSEKNPNKRRKTNAATPEPTTSPQQHQLTTGGWLHLADPFQRFQMPYGLQLDYCRNDARTDKICPRGTACLYTHISGHEIPPGDRQILEAAQGVTIINTRRRNGGGNGRGRGQGGNGNNQGNYNQHHNNYNNGGYNGNNNYNHNYNNNYNNQGSYNRTWNRNETNPGNGNGNNNGHNNNQRPPSSPGRSGGNNGNNNGGNNNRNRSNSGNNNNRNGSSNSNNNQNNQ